MSQLVSDPAEAGWTNEVIHARYERYLREHHGEIDIANLIETMCQWSANRTVEALVTFSEIGPQLGRIEQQVRRMRELTESLTGGSETHG